MSVANTEPMPAGPSMTTTTASLERLSTSPTSRAHSPVYELQPKIGHRYTTPEPSESPPLKGYPNNIGAYSANEQKAHSNGTGGYSPNEQKTYSNDNRGYSHNGMTFEPNVRSRAGSVYEESPAAPVMTASNRPKTTHVGSRRTPHTVNTNNTNDNQGNVSPEYELQPKIGHRYTSPEPSHSPPLKGYPNNIGAYSADEQKTRSNNTGGYSPNEQKAYSNDNRGYSHNGMIFERDVTSRAASVYEESPGPPVMTGSSRPKTTHVGSGRTPHTVSINDNQDDDVVPPSPSVRPMTSIYRGPGQQYETTDLFERSRSRNRTRSINSQPTIDESPTRQPQQQRSSGFEVTGMSLSPGPKNYDDIQPKIGIHYSHDIDESSSRSVSPKKYNNDWNSTTNGRSNSRNAMTQVDVDLPPRNSSQQRGYIEMTGREARSASRQEVPNLNGNQYGQPQTQPRYQQHVLNDGAGPQYRSAPNNQNGSGYQQPINNGGQQYRSTQNINSSNQNGYQQPINNGGQQYRSNQNVNGNGYQQQMSNNSPTYRSMQNVNYNNGNGHQNNGNGQQQYDQQQPRQMSYSRHFEHPTNGHQRNNGHNRGDNNGDNNETRGMRPSTSLTLLPLAREANAFSFKDKNKYSRPGSDWNLTTTKRAYRFSEEGFAKARSKPFKQVPSLKIAVEGKRYLSPEKKDVFVRFPNRITRSARPDQRATPPTPNPLFSHSPTQTQYDEPVPLQPGYSQPKPPGMQLPQFELTGRAIADSPYYGSSTGTNMSMVDSRFAEGTTTKSTYKQPSSDAFSEKWRPKPVVPETTLKMEGEHTRRTSSATEHYPVRPYCRELPSPRKASIAVHNKDVVFKADTTYKRTSESVLGSPLKRAVRFDPCFRRPDSIDWM